MKLVKVIKNGQVVQPVKFDNDADMNAWIQMLAETAAWGKPERWLVDSVQTPLSEEDKAKAIDTRIVEVYPRIPEYIDEQGNVIPEVHAVTVTEYKFAAEYSIDIKDITAEVRAEKQAKEAKKLAKEKRKADRKAVDWSKNLTTKQLQEIVKNLVEDQGD